ncbi:MAG: DUF4382 domain-containing protein [Gammaproteobacteria bacterium]|nr:DUF4382 domain-containing protein [Gammaproteobacteria bacterium]
MIIAQRIQLVTIAAVVACATGCGGGSSQSLEDPASGRISLGISDAPVQDAHQVCLSFAAVEFHKAGAATQIITFNPPQTVDLLAFQGMNAAPLLVDETLEAGEYQWVRLAIDSAQGGNGGAGAGSNDTECLGEGSYIVTTDGGVYNLYIPSSAQSGLQLNQGFTLAIGGTADFIAEFDLMRSIRSPQGLDPDYIMRPTIRLHDRLETGSIVGSVSPNLAGAPDCMPAVYVYTAGDTPDDYEDDAPGDSVDPVASAIVKMHGGGNYTYEVGPLVAGTYNVAFSCDDDDPLQDQVLDYVGSAANPVEVTASSRATADF